MSKKHVFKMWQNQVKIPSKNGETGLVTFRQLINIFPEFREKLNHWQSNCDENGRLKAKGS